MDTPQSAQGGMKCELCGGAGSPAMVGRCCHGHRRGGVLAALVRGIMAILILVVVFSLVVSFFVMHRWGMPWNMAGYGFNRSSDAVVVPWGTMMGRWGIDKDASRVFGVIKSINGATITILDNSNTKRTVVSVAATIITDGEQELSLSNLKVGQRIGVTGESDGDVLTAQLIEVADQ